MTARCSMPAFASLMATCCPISGREPTRSQFSPGILKLNWHSLSFTARRATSVTSTLAGYILQGDDRIKVNRSTLTFITSAVFRSLRGRIWKATRCAPCMPVAERLTTTWKRATNLIWKTLNMLWNDLMTSQMYVTGGVGARSQGEAFGDAYELPNFTAYGESCAAIGNMMWNWRMLTATGEAKYADVIERALYNGINSGMSLDGTLYCYRNPLGFDPSGGDHIRNPWYDTTCCPPNLERTFASLPGYFYSTSKDGLYVHLYDNSQLDWHLERELALKVVQKTNYPVGWRRGNYPRACEAHRLYVLSSHSGLVGRHSGQNQRALLLPARLPDKYLAVAASLVVR